VGDKKRDHTPLEMLIDEFVNALAEGDHYGGQYNDADNPFCQYFFHIYPPLQNSLFFCNTDSSGKKLQQGDASSKKRLTFSETNAIVAVSAARALSSAGERFVHTEEVTGSIPVAPILSSLSILFPAI
jgi:hypothetical protein